VWEWGGGGGGGGGGGEGRLPPNTHPVPRVCACELSKLAVSALYTAR